MSDASSDTSLIHNDNSLAVYVPAKRLGHPLSVIAITAVLFIISQVVAFALVSAAARLLHVHSVSAEWLNNSPVAQFFYIALAEVMVIGGVVFYTQKRRVSLSALGIKRPNLRAFKFGLIGFAVYYALLITVSAVLFRFIPSLNNNQQQDIGFNGVAGSGLLLAFISLCILAPLGEEILMRGFLFSALRSRMRFVKAAH